MSDVDKLDLSDRRPPYLQVAGKLRASLREGYEPGDRLPAHQEVATQYGVSIGTVKRAFAVLQREQVIVTRQGQGSFVVRVPEADEAGETVDADVEALRETVERLSRRVTAIERRLGADDASG